MNAVEQELTPDEKKKPYAKYFYMAANPPAKEVLAELEQPMDPAKALKLEDINSLLDPGYHEKELGWCVMPDGTGYAANYIKMSGVTVEMVNWWYAWHSLEDLRYKLWWPRGHFGVSISESDRQKVLNPDRKLTEKFQGTTHHVLEDVGGGPAEITISFITPEQVGFDMKRFKEPAVGTVIPANIQMKPVDAPENVKGMGLFMIHFIRSLPDGIEYRSRFWIGKKIIDKKPQTAIPAGMTVPEIMPHGSAIHNAEEYANLAVILPQIYQEQQGRIP